MRIAKIKINNFRGIQSCELVFADHLVLVGDNNTGKSTILEAIDLVLGPERLSRYPVINEYDFYSGKYKTSDDILISINIEITLNNLTDEEQRYFRENLEWWDRDSKRLLDSPTLEATDYPNVETALRVYFNGQYDPDNDDFYGNTFYSFPKYESDTNKLFRSSDKRICGFLYLHTLRTASRALSLDRGSLLDIVLRLKNKKIKMWEDVIDKLKTIVIADNSELGIYNILKSIQDAISSFVPTEWSENPHFFVSDLTRETLRKTLTVFLDTGADISDTVNFSAPFYYQGTGTINIIVLALLSIIAEEKQNVIFAMEEPEIAIPPYTQKRIVNFICKNSSQAIFTSHSPYVLEEFNPEQILILRKYQNVLSGISATYPPGTKPKAFKEDLKQKYCESLMSRRILITEGRTEYDAYIAVSRRLNEVNPIKYKSLELQGIAVVNAESENNIAKLGKYYKDLGKIVIAICDKQDLLKREIISQNVDHLFESSEKGIEKLILNNSSYVSLKRFAISLESENSLLKNLHLVIPNESSSNDDFKTFLESYFLSTKGNGGISNFLYQCSETELPKEITDTLTSIQTISETASLF